MCTTILCCAGREACSAVCACCKCCCSMTMKQQVRLGYVVMNLVFFLFAIFILHYVQGFLDYFSGYIHCPKEAGGNLDCLGVSSVYRISFALALMYFIILLFVWARNECSKMFNEGLWLLKVLFVSAIFIIFMYVDYSFFDGYRDFARIFGALFLLIQSVMLIDIFYFWGERWKASYDDGATWMAYTLVITSVILYGLAITLVVLNFVWFNGCGMNTFINVTNLVLCIVVTAVQVLGFNPKGSLITSGSISLYMTFLTFSAMLSGDISCNLAMTTENIFTIELVVGLILLLVVLIYLTFASKKTSSKTMQVAQGVELNAAIIADEEHVDEDDDEQDGDDEEHSINKKKKAEKDAEAAAAAAAAKANAAAANGELTKEERDREKWLNCDKSMRPYVYTNKYIIFHIVMLTSSVYGCMLLTNWGNPDMSSSTFNMYQPSSSSYWIKIIISWASSILYLWTLIAPAIFPDREFISDL